MADPAGAVMALYRDAASGNAAALDGKPAGVLLRKMRGRCLQFPRLDVRIRSVSGSQALVDVDGELASWLAGAVPGPEPHHAIASLTLVNGEWVLDSLRTREDVLADEIVAAPAPQRREVMAKDPALRTPLLAKILAHRAMDRVNQGRLAEATERYELARDVAEELGDPAAMAVATSVRSVLQRHAHDINGSLATAREAVALAEESGDPDALAVCLTRLARADALAGGPGVRATLHRVLDMADTIEDPAIVALAASVLAGHEDEASDQPRAFRYALLAAKYARESGEAAAIVSSEMNLAAAHYHRGDCRAAMPHIDAAASVAEKAGFAGSAASVLHWKAECLSYGEDHDAFERTSDRALAMAARSKGGGEVRLVVLLTQRASYAVERNRLDDAACYLHQALVVSEGCGIERAVCLSESWTSSSLLGLAQGRWEEALYFARVAERPELAAHALRGLGRMDEARQALQEAIAKQETLRSHISSERARTLFFPRLARMYAALIELELETGAPHAAFVAATRMRARVIRELQDGAFAATLTPAERQEERALDRTINDLNQRLLQARNDDRRRDGIQRQLAVARRQLDTFHARTQQVRLILPPGPSSSVELPELRPGLALLTYAVLETRTILFVATRGSGGATHLRAMEIEAGQKELAALVAQYRRQLTNRDVGWHATARTLAALLIHPAASAIRNAKEIAIAPDGDLWGLPFPTLSSPDGRLLLESHAVFSVLSPGGLSVPPAGETGGGGAPRVLAFANPSLGSHSASMRAAFRTLDLGALEDAETEVRELARIYGPRSSKVYIGKEARESAFKREANQAQIIHVATHGIVDVSDPMYSALLLTSSPDTGDDGLLEARELARMPISAELAVLSACDTGRGEFRPGEGVMGLSWALLSTGTSNVVVSQWKADSKATARLMIDFHREYARGASPAAALRKAALQLRKSARYADPLYWAPFIVIGTN